MALESDDQRCFPSTSFASSNSFPKAIRFTCLKPTFSIPVPYGSRRSNCPLFFIFRHRRHLYLLYSHLAPFSFRTRKTVLPYVKKKIHNEQDRRYESKHLKRENGHQLTPDRNFELIFICILWLLGAVENDICSTRELFGARYLLLWVKERQLDIVTYRGDVNLAACDTFWLEWLFMKWVAQFNSLVCKKARQHQQQDSGYWCKHDNLCIWEKEKYQFLVTFVKHGGNKPLLTKAFQNFKFFFWKSKTFTRKMISVTKYATPEVVKNKVSATVFMETNVT